MARMTKKGLLIQGLALVVVAAGTLVFRSSLCNLLFRCGCESALAAAGAFCNIHGMHHLMANGVACPWCSHGAWGHHIPTGAILVAQAAVLFVPMNLSIRNRFLLSVAAFFVVGAAVGLVFGIFSGYPVFLGIRIS